MRNKSEDSVIIQSRSRSYRNRYSSCECSGSRRSCDEGRESRSGDCNVAVAVGAGVARATGGYPEQCERR
jgi:hypothetical protein